MPSQFALVNTGRMASVHQRAGEQLALPAPSTTHAALDIAADAGASRERMPPRPRATCSGCSCRAATQRRGVGGRLGRTDSKRTTAAALKRRTLDAFLHHVVQLLLLRGIEPQLAAELVVNAHFGRAALVRQPVRSGLLACRLLLLCEPLLGNFFRVVPALQPRVSLHRDLTATKP